MAKCARTEAQLFGEGGGHERDARGEVPVEGGGADACTAATVVGDTHRALEAGGVRGKRVIQIV
ncbi:hypothetical protein [Streptomyces sp. NPDC002580]|uniref:hypothetical protein n=1 Tax=Streptomyces sp. NPDC002580 TaxID=3364653 RepID=UPI003678F41A